MTMVAGIFKVKSVFSQNANLLNFEFVLL